MLRSSGAYSYSQTGIDRVAGLYVQGPGVLYASAGNSIFLTAAEVAGNGAVQLNAANNVNINTLTTSQTNNFNAGDAKNHLLTSQTSDAGSTISSGTNTRQSTTTTQSTTTLGGAFSAIAGGFTLEDKTSTDSQATASSIGTKLISNEKVTIGVGNKTELQGTEVEAPQIAFVKTDPSKKGELILGGSTNTNQTSHTKKIETAGVYQEMKGQGSTTQTLNQTQLKGNVSFDSALKISAQIPDTKGGQTLKSQINALASQSGGTGLEYLNQLAANPNVQWDKVALANEKWSYSQAGLTPAGAALLTIAVAAYAPGLSTGITSAVGGGSIAAGLNAGFIALQSQAAVALVNNGGDISKTLEQLGSEQSIKNLLTVMVTAGALSNLNQTLGFNGQSGAGASGTNGITTGQAANQFTSNLLKNVTNNVAGAAIDSAINGKPLDEKALASALSSALVTAGMAQGANAIGDAASSQNGSPPLIDSFTQKLAHAVLGCAGGSAIAGDTKGCASGAVGGVLGEMAADYYRQNHSDPTLSTEQNNANALAFAKVMSATSGVLVGGGGNNVAAVNIANTTGTNAAANNRLLHPTEAQWIKDNAKRYAQQRYGTETPSSSQIQAAAAELANTAQALLDNNSGVTVPKTAQAESFLAQLKIEYIQANGNLNLPGTSGDPGGTQQLFYANTEQKNMPWLNQGLADAAITGLIVRTPITPPKAGDKVDTTRDRKTGLPLDNKGRYEVQVTLDGQGFSPKFYPCATDDCIRSGGNLDMSDPGTQAYVKALDQQVFKDIGTGATAGTLVTPVGPGSTLLMLLGFSASGGQVATSETQLQTAGDEFMKAASEKSGETFFREVLGHTPSAAARASALINLSGGWDAFVNRVKVDVFGIETK